MRRNVFFSFDYDDAWFCQQIQQCHAFGWDGPTFLPWSDWEAVRRQSRTAIQNWINDQLTGASVTVVVIGQETFQSEWVRYEIEESVRRRKGILGILTHNMRTSRGLLGGLSPPPNPFVTIGARDYGRNSQRGILYGGAASLYEQVDCYCWVTQNGRSNLPGWIERAISDVERTTVGALASTLRRREL